MKTGIRSDFGLVVSCLELNNAQSLWNDALLVLLGQELKDFPYVCLESQTSQLVLFIC